MRFIKRLLDGHSFFALAVVGCLATIGAGASCSNEDGTARGAPSDGGADTSVTTDDASHPEDAGPADATSRPWFDGGPLPIDCATPPCARSLVTTLGADESLVSSGTVDRGEGFCALLDDGTVACWGANQAGQLGRGEDAGSADDATPALVRGLSDVVQLDHTCALDKSGAVWCWGPNLPGDAGTASHQRAPVKMSIPPAKRVGMGTETGCAVVEDGVFCWGKNKAAQIAPLDELSAGKIVPPRSVQVPAGAPIRDIHVGVASFALRTDGTTLSWGANPPLARVSSRFPEPRPRPIVLEHVSSLDVAGDNACATAGGTGYCWGAVASSNPKHPNLDRALPEPVVTPEPLVQIATTRTVGTGDTIERHQRWCAVAASGAVYCWGNNASGQAGDGTTDYAPAAVKVRGLPAPAAQVRTTPNSTCALLTSGKVYCWGTNFYGQLGNGKLRIPSFVPQEVVMP